MQTSELLALWAKTPRDGGVSQEYHPLICHMIDVAMVTRTMWHEALTPALRWKLTEGIGIEADDAEFWIPFLAGLHDIGKASPGFQAKDSRSQSRLAAAGFRTESDADDPGHGIIGALVIPEILRTDFDVPPQIAIALATAIGGHHGRFPHPLKIQCHNNRHARGGRRWDTARLALARDLAETLGYTNQAAPQQAGHATVMVLAGLVSVADWIGSDERFFRYAASNDQSMPELASLAGYAERAETQARTALEKLGWLGWKPASESLPFTSLFPALPGSPRPVQTRIAELPGIDQAPGLVIVELPMGEGKTEAALYLADRWGVTLGQRGIYIAMPTMATANQMFSRVHEYLTHRYPESEITVQLLHSHAALASDLEALEPGEPVVTPSNIESDFDQNGSELAIAAGEWFTRRKRGLLALFGVGTVDQSFLAALQIRHVFVRLFGLAGKTVIFDEVHAYDVYMSTIFKRLLEWLAALGSSVIILSATLPDDRRGALINAYARGAGRPLAKEVSAGAYPRLTWFGADGAGAESVAVSEQAKRTLTVARVDGQLPDDASGSCELGARLEAALADGGCAAVICNTVNRAQQVYQALKPYVDRTASDGQPELDLFHARYLFQDRMIREQQTLVRFGKPDGTVTMGDGTTAKVRRPERAVLVATQVIEQSLDLDFDLMVTDMAPVDFLLQRSGRLHRHERPPRPEGLQEPVLWICEPRIDERGIPDFGQSNEAVYDKHVLLRSWLALQGRTTIRIPDDIGELIEAVYDERACPEDLDATQRAIWDETREAYLSQCAEEEREATKRWLGWPGSKGSVTELMSDPREEDAPDFHREHQALTRLIEPSVSVICLYGTEQHATYDRAGQQAVPTGRSLTARDAKRLLMRSVTLSDRRIVRALIQQDVPARWQRSSLLRHHRRVLLDERDRAVIGGYQLRLDDELGLLVEKRR